MKAILTYFNKLFTLLVFGSNTSMAGMNWLELLRVIFLQTKTHQKFNMIAVKINNFDSFKEFVSIFF